MEASDLDRVRKNVASGTRIYLRMVPEEWTVCEPLAPNVAAPPDQLAPDPDALAGALVSSHIAMTAEEAMAFLRQKQVAVLGTVDGEGTPRGRPVRYTVGRGVLHLTVPRLSPSLVDLAEGPRAAATIEEFPSVQQDPRGDGPWSHPFLCRSADSGQSGGVDRSRAACRPTREFRLQQNKPRPLSSSGELLTASEAGWSCADDGVRSQHIEVVARDTHAGEDFLVGSPRRGRAGGTRARRDPTTIGPAGRRLVPTMGWVTFSQKPRAFIWSSRSTS